MSYILMKEALLLVSGALLLVPGLLKELHGCYNYDLFSTQ